MLWMARAGGSEELFDRLRTMTSVSLGRGFVVRGWRTGRGSWAVPEVVDERVAADLGVTTVTVAKWRDRFLEEPPGWIA
jgi:hypothetical protein